MREVKVLGTGCANCRNTAALVEDVARERGVAIRLEKVEALPEIARYGIMATPGIVVDGKVVHAGGVPRREKIAEWLTSDAVAKPAGGCGGRCSCG
jgi:small redox-active disulfide protein 2